MSRFDLSRLPVPVIQGGMGVGVSLLRAMRPNSSTSTPRRWD